MDTKQFLEHEINRRQFLGSSAKNAAGMAAGMVGLAGTTLKAAPNERVSVAVIGVRNRGKQLAQELASLPEAQVVALCDVDENLLPAAAKPVIERQGRAPDRLGDFRHVLDDGSIDAVAIATPDHWHAAMAVRACLAGKDVYLETPATHHIAEGRPLLDVAAAEKRVVQVGIQERSAAHFRSAIDVVQSGQIGRVNLAKAWTVHRRKPIGHRRDTAVPEGVNYDLWLGPAPARPFNPNRFHHNWQWFWDYGGGELGRWGTHLLETARWGLNVELPERISATGGLYSLDDQRETPDTLIVNYAFPADGSGPGKTIVWEHRLWSSHGLEGRSAAAAFYGEQGTLIVDRGGWKVYDSNQSLTSDSSQQLAAHVRNFVSCVKSRQTPNCDLKTGLRAGTLCHLGNIAYRLGREVAFDPETLTFANDPDANSLLARECRTEWEQASEA